MSRKTMPKFNVSRVPNPREVHMPPYDEFNILELDISRASRRSL